MFEKINAQSRNAEVSDICDQTNLIYNNSSLYNTPYLSKLFAELIPMYNQLVGALNFLKASSELESLDIERDDAVRAPFYLVQGALYNPDATVKKAAETINKVLGNYTLEITRENYSTESAQINSLLKDLSATKLQESIAAIQGLSDLIAALSNAQEKFQTASVEFEKIKSDEADYDNATQLKRKIITFMNSKFICFLEGILVVDEETYGEFAKAIAQLIADKNVIVRKRSKAEKETATTEL